MKNQKEFVQSLFSKKEQKNLWILPSITNGEVILENEKIVSWLHPSGHIGYMVYNDGNNIRAFMMDRMNSSKQASDKAGICDWCKSVNSINKLAMFSFKTTENKTVGFYLCSDLDCLSSINNPGPHSIRETLTREEKRIRYFHNFETFVSKYFAH